VRGIKKEALEILNPYHPHPSLPHRSGRGSCYPPNPILELFLLVPKFLKIKLLITKYGAKLGVAKEAGIQGGFRTMAR